MNASATLGQAWDQVRAAAPSLHPGQRRVAEVLLAMTSQELARASAGEIAERSDTSPATVVRTCQQLGFSGFRECVMRLAVDAQAAGAGDANDGDEADGSAGAFLRAAASALVHAASTIDESVVAAVGVAISSARRVAVVSYGWSVPAGEALALGLAGLSLAVESPTDFQRQIVVASTLAPGDVCIVVCFTGSHRHARLVARVARERGATVILVSTFSRSLAAEHADHNVIFGGVATGEAHPRQPISTVVQFATMEAIRLAVAAAIGPDASVSPALLALVESGVDGP